MQADRDTFGPRLRLERERRGIELKAIADATKIKESLFAELERNDFSKWPQGIFRRAHLCAYVSAIGLPSQAVLAEFLQLFPESPQIEPSDSPQASGSSVIQQIQKPRRSGGLAMRVMDRAWVTCFDLALVCLISSGIASLPGVNLWQAIALVGLGYTAAGNACFGQSIGARVQRRIAARLQTRSAPGISVTTPLREMQPMAPKRPPVIFAHAEVNREPETERRRASA